MILLYHLILMQRLDRRIIFVKEQFSDGYLRITLHISLDGLHILGFEHILAHRLVHSPHNLAHVKVAIQLGTGIEVLHLIVAEQIEGKTIRHDILALHGATLLRRIEFLLERIGRTHILIKRNAYGMLTHHDTLVERSNLGIEIRLRKFWIPPCRL